MISTTPWWPRALAIMIATALHLGFFMQAGGNHGAVQPKPDQSPSITRLSFSQPAAQPNTNLPPITEKKTPQPQVKPKAKPQKKPKRHEPVRPAKPTPPQSPPKEEPTAEEQPTSAPAIASASVATPAIDPGILASQREQYLAAVMAHIEQYKSYPISARRRGISGEVHVSFLLHDNGHVSNVHTDGAAKILLQAAARTLDKALPLPIPPQHITTPLNCRFTLKFSLK